MPGGTVMAQSITLTLNERETYRKYAALPLPRHTSYPIAPVWSEAFDSSEYRKQLRQLDEAGELSLYVHVPFCEQLCYYCACTKEIVPAERRLRHDPVVDLLEGLRLESARVSDAAGSHSVRQVHLGGGSPTYLTPTQLVELWEMLSGRFQIADDAEIAIEVDPRITSLEHLRTLRGLGFNRISLGIQDFSP